ncbi:cytochrome C biogenesis protein [Echinicola strongylocentroti]|uniref:Cytochrome C biogenesis protein n=2 Tax=Echinicola strongylocentroti TaxID=1795355 RepID=A0A2Z4IHU2_9BACT|nr:cytochrome C biogenesis protein [Echinicola strongylocentroti]
MRFLKLLVSSKFMLLLLLTFATAMAVATFMENDFGTAVAWAVIYESWWFEMVMVLLAVNFIANIKRYGLFSRQKWPIGLFHVAFIVVIIGAGITRYFSHTGTIHIREGQAQNVYYTQEKYLQVQQNDPNNSLHFQKPFKLTSQTFRPQEVALPNSDGLKIRISDFIPHGRPTFQKGEEDYLDIALTLGEGREDIILPIGKSLPMKELHLATQPQAAHPIKIYKGDSSWMISTDVHLQVMQMSNQNLGVLHAGETKPLKLRSLYQWENGAFLIKATHEDSQLAYREEKDPKLAEQLPDVVTLEVLDKTGNLLQKNHVQLVKLNPTWNHFTYQGKNYQFTYGPKAQQLPFSLYLKHFDMQRYPGSQSPSSYASELIVEDGQQSFDFRIYMNNVLDHGGYRFYQASYDTDEQGTVLSINQDKLGSTLTYIGYFLLGLGMFFTLFTLNSRFQYLNKHLQKIKNVATLLLVFVSGASIAQEMSKTAEWVVPETQANRYGQLVVQDLDGRMKPLGTLANEIIRKLNGKSSIALDEGQLELSPEQFLLAMQMYPEMMGSLPIINIDEQKGLHIYEALKLPPSGKVSFLDFVDDEGQYKLQTMVEKANLLKPSERNEGDNELLKVDERFNIFFGLLSGDFLKLFPNRLDENHTWFTRDNSTQNFPEEDIQFVRYITGIYLEGLQQGLETDNWQKANESLEYIDLYQRKAGEAVYPSDSRLQAERFYNKLSLGNRLFGVFWLLGIFMMVIAIWQTFTENKWTKRLWRAGMVLSGLGMLAFTFHLGLRWYIAQHPPWSDGFEMLVFVGWGVLLFGLLFSRKSRFTVPLGLLFSGTLLFVAFLEWLNPEITNLMPVLHSYWLKIHVAIIVSSYAPLALAAVMALLSMILLIFSPKSPLANWWRSLLELTIVNEMAITIGLFLLTIGTFLGGVWANESWGRYWAWDPKETWALISILVYASVLHLRLIPGLKNFMVYQLASLWAFASIVMTSFGVNYYLSGLHSYAKGDPVPIPSWVYWCVAILLVISIGAILRYKNFPATVKSYLKV